MSSVVNTFLPFVFIPATGKTFAQHPEEKDTHETDYKGGGMKEKRFFPLSWNRADTDECFRDFTLYDIFKKTATWADVGPTKSRTETVSDRP